MRQVRELPKATRAFGSEPYVAKDVREFVRSGARIAEVTYEGRDAKQIVVSLRKFVQSRGIERIAVVQRDKRAFLVREEVTR